MDDIKDIFPDGNPGKIQINTSDVVFNSKTLDVQPTISVFQAIDENFNTLNGSIAPIGNQLEFLLNTRDMSDQMVVTRLSAWYYDSGTRTLHEYQTVKQALDQNPDFAGKISYASDFSFDEPWLELSGRTLTIDLQGHTFTCTSRNLVNLRLGSDITVQNGKLVLSSLGGNEEESKFKIGHGTLSLKNMNIEADVVNSVNYRLFDLSQNFETEIAGVTTGNSAVNLDKDCTINVYAGDSKATLFYVSSPYKCAYDAGQVADFDEFKIEYPDWQNLAPIVDIDCQIRISEQAAELRADSLFITDGTEDERLGPVFNINGNTKIYSDTVGFYMGTCGTVNFSGYPTIIANTGICLRGGTLNIPKNSNPTIIGVGDGGSYDPRHQSIDVSKSLSCLDLGHAVVLESNGALYGGIPVSADIRAGNFISHSNTAIGSYGAAADTASEYTVGIQSGGETLYFNRRADRFAEDIDIDRRESQTAYVYETGANPDYQIAKNAESQTASKNAVKFESGISADLSYGDGLKSALSSVLVLLGVEKRNITV